MGWKDKWLRQDTGPVHGKHKNTSGHSPGDDFVQRGRSKTLWPCYCSIFRLSGNVFPTGIFQAAVQTRPGCGSGPPEDRCIPLKRSELKAGGGPRTAQYGRALWKSAVAMHSRFTHFGYGKWWIETIKKIFLIKIKKNKHDLHCLNEFIMSQKQKHSGTKWKLLTSISIENV